MNTNAENGENIPLEKAVGMYFTTPSYKRVHVLSVEDIPTAQGQGIAMVQGQWDTKPWACEFCLLYQGGPKYVRKNPTSHQFGCDW